MSIESQILALLETALKAVLIANGYQTDAGTSVFKDLEYQTAPEASIWPCIIYFPGELQSGNEGDVPPSLGEQNNFLPIRLESYITDDERGTAGQQVKEDLRKVITSLGYFDGLAELVQGYKSGTDVQPGSDGFWSSVYADFVIFYVTPWGEI